MGVLPWRTSSLCTRRQSSRFTVAVRTRKEPSLLGARLLIVCPAAATAGLVRSLARFSTKGVSGQYPRWFKAKPVSRGY